jgi:Bacterial aa3 type cytochrome c oxidase subunit IV
MADHGNVEYATAAGNDLPAHEATYENFVHMSFIIGTHVVNLVFGLATGGVMGHWLTALMIFIIAIIGVVVGLMTGSRTSSYIAFALSFVIFAFTGLSH